MTNLNDMTRSELKALVRRHGWDKGDDQIDLRSGTDEIRALVEPRIAALNAALADVLSATQEPDDETGEVAPEPTSAAAEVDVSPPPTFRVERFSKWVKDGVVYQLRAGTFVTTASHPIDELFAQGVPLVEVVAADDSDPGVGHRFT